MTDHRALLTDREREILRGIADVSRNYVHQIRHRIRQKIERFPRDIEILDSHHPDLADELRQAMEPQFTSPSARIEQLRAVIEASPDPIIALDRDGEIQLWNTAAEEVFGYAADEATGRPITSLGLHADEELERFEDRFRRILDGETFEGLVVSRRTKTGEKVYLQISTAPLYDDAGEIDGLMAVAQNITETKRSEQRYRTLAENFPGGAVLVFDRDLRYLRAYGDGFDTAGFDPEAFEGAHISEVFDGRTLETKRELYEATLEGEHTTSEMEFAGREYRVHTIPVRDEDGEVIEGIVMTQDVTEYKEGEVSGTGGTPA